MYSPQSQPQGAFGTCPECGAHFRRSVEKGVDSALVTDLLALGFENAYAVGILVSSDADFVPAVQFLQHRGAKIINAAWPDTGHDLKKSSWADIDLSACKTNLVRVSPRPVDARPEPVHAVTHVLRPSAR